MDTVWHLEWAHGAFDVHARGGMLGGVAFFSGARVIRPFYEPPWLGEPAARPDGLLGVMRSEFACVPFGVPYAPDGLAEGWRDAVATPAAAHDAHNAHDAPLDASDDLQHGYGCIADWTCVRRTSHEIEIALDYPAGSPIARVTRTIRADPQRAALEFVLRIDARTAARRPAGLHPNLALPSLAGAFRIEPGAFRFGVVHPGGPEPGVSHGRPGATFETLDRVPLADGEYRAFDRLPFADATEEIVQLCGIDGSVTLHDDVAGTAYRLTWDAAVLPSLLLWISNRGRAYAPWNGRNLCVGVEPVASAFELGCHASLAPNPINARGVATALTLDPARPLEIAYRFDVLDALDAR
ncbi:hypothetical protein DID96_22625 [Burkholderia sp. Bp8963]|uniref:hypothetical protein n=1 Tax=Burkholderia sp. Bp8963 TaxID=2184547 RepID=UPI000F5B28C0|nr:hypothetical protein [Burkholderia sp. Bp8963]RQS67044.1 hypothetical protein DID96_22625 [Burkholderia sp. Bp8963]